MKYLWLICWQRRSGNEAADILAEVLRLNPKIKFPGSEEDK